MAMQEDKGTALITGASAGIGALYADRLARRGYDLLLVARDRQRLEAMAERLSRSYGVEVEVLPADLTDKHQLEHVERRLRGDASISMLVNNAGVVMEGPLAEADLGKTDQMMQLNVVAPTLLAAAAAANFGAAGRGAIINLSSVAALAPDMLSATYCATKAYMLSLSQSLEGELGQLGVRVQAVLPGVTRTEIWERSGANLAAIPERMVMEGEVLVDAALAGFDLGETVTIPSLPDDADWDALMEARSRLRPNLSHSKPAPRYSR